MYDGSDTVILFEELAYQDILPVAWRPLPDQIDPDLAASYGASNVRVLQASTALQEQGPTDKADENSLTRRICCASSSRSICCSTWWDASSRRTSRACPLWRSNSMRLGDLPGSRPSAVAAEAGRAGQCRNLPP